MMEDKKGRGMRRSNVVVRVMRRGVGREGNVIKG